MKKPPDAGGFDISTLPQAEAGAVSGDAGVGSDAIGAAGAATCAVAGAVDVVSAGGPGLGFRAVLSASFFRFKRRSRRLRFWTLLYCLLIYASLHP